MISKIIDEELIQKIDLIIQASHSLVIITHENPDGDAIGSSLAMADFLKCRGKESVKVMIPNDLPSFCPGCQERKIF
jgi:Exopolyphosphatase-related proteins